MSAQHTQGRLSVAMLDVLRKAEAGLGLYSNCGNRSQYGARMQTIKALRRRGLIAMDSPNLTDAGRAAIAKATGAAA